MIDSSKWEVIEAGLKCVQGKAIVNSISLKEGEEKFVRAGPAVPQVRRRGRRHGLRRGRPGRQPRAPHGRSAGAPTTSSSTQVGFPAEDIIFDPNIFAVATGIEEHANYGARLHRGHPLDQAEPARRAGLRRRLERLVLLPRQQPGARGDPRGVPVPRDRGRHGHGHRQRRRRSRSTTRSTPSCASASRTSILNRRPDSTERLLEIAGRLRRRRRGRGGRHRGVARRCRSASGSPTRW